MMRVANHLIQIMEKIKSDCPLKVVAFYTVQEKGKKDWEQGLLIETENGILISMLGDDLNEMEKKSLQEKLFKAREMEIKKQFH